MLWNAAVLHHQWPFATSNSSYNSFTPVLTGFRRELWRVQRLLGESQLCGLPKAYRPPHPSVCQALHVQLRLGARRWHSSLPGGDWHCRQHREGHPELLSRDRQKDWEYLRAGGGESGEKSFTFLPLWFQILNSLPGFAGWHSRHVSKQLCHWDGQKDESSERHPGGGHQ